MISWLVSGLLTSLSGNATTVVRSPIVRSYVVLARTRYRPTSGMTMVTGSCDTLTPISAARASSLSVTGLCCQPVPSLVKSSRISPEPAGSPGAVRVSVRGARPTAVLSCSSSLLARIW